MNDPCILADTAHPGLRVWVALAVIPVNDAQAAAIRKSDEAVFSHYAAKVTDGGVGTGSWALNPVAAAPWLVFRHTNRLIRLRMDADGVGTLEDLRSIAQAILTLPGGLSSAPAVIARPECDRGSVAAERALGEKIVARRDSLKDGHLSCQWGSPTRSIAVESGGVGSKPADTFAWIKDTTGRDKADWPERVNVGVEGWKEDDGYLAFRTSKQKYVVVAASQSIVMTASQSIPVDTFARAIAPVFGG